MSATEAVLLNKMDGTAVVINNDLNTGFSTPPSSSLDTCDSGFTELYSNNFTLINSTKQMDDKSVEVTLSTTAENLNYGDGGDSDNVSAVLSDCASAENSDAYIEKASESSTDEDVIIEDSNISEEPNDETNEIDENDYADDESDDFDDAESNSSGMSDLSDVFKLNAEIVPEMQRSINWVS